MPSSKPQLSCILNSNVGVWSCEQSAELEGLADRRCGVQDFNWLRQTQSPNWHVMDESADATEKELRAKDFTALRSASKLS